MEGNSRESQFFSSKPSWLIVGLGNPGEEYVHTYHNAGFRVVERLAGRASVRFSHKCGPALVTDEVVIAGQAAVLVQPQTYMNLAGAVLTPLFERFGAHVQEIIVVYDDLALPLGKLRVRQKGSDGGHNGVKSIISAAGTDQFMRVRIGILPERPVANVRDFVLSRVSAGDKMLLDRAEAVAATAVETLIGYGIDKAMAEYNGIDLREASNASGEESGSKVKDN